MTLSIDAEILVALSDDLVEERTKQILELAKQAWPADEGSFLMGLGIGQWVNAGKSDAEIMAIVGASLDKLRSFMREHLQPEGEDPS